MENMNLNSMPISQTPLGGGEKKSYGPLIAVVIILFLIVIGGLYFLGQRMSRGSYENLQQPTQDEVTQSLKTQSDSDEVNSIEADLNATDVSSLDQGAAVIESQLEY